MKDRFTMDAEKLRQEGAKQLQEQQKRLHNMSEANLQKIRSENSQQLNEVREILAQKERQLQQQNAQISAEIERKRVEANQLRAQLEAKRKRKRRGGKQILLSRFYCSLFIIGIVIA
jgi:23S rRNA pseudoU1915 N3-methylase RlmH